jgi:hypothetical protein
LKADRTWMYGVNAGYDGLGLHPAAPSWGHTAGLNARNVTFGQAALGVEAVGERWELEATAAVGVGNTEQRITTYALAGVLDTYGARIGYHPNDDTVVSVGYYYQEGDLDVAGSGVRAGVETSLTPAVTARLNISHDDAYDTRVSAGISVGFGGGRRKTARSSWALNALSRKPQGVVRIHDAGIMIGDVTYDDYLACALQLAYIYGGGDMHSQFTQHVGKLIGWPLADCIVEPFDN